MIIKYLTLLLVCCSTLVIAQNSNVATLKYDVIRQLNMEMRSQSQSNDGEAPMPQVISEERVIYFKDTLACYQRAAGGARMFKQLGGSGFKLPFDEITFIDMKNSREVTSLTLLRDSLNEMYYSIEPLVRTNDWKDTDKTKKILGYNCTKAKVITPNGDFDVWYAKDSEFNFSPVPGLLPAKGLVLKIDGTELSYSATSLEKKLENPAQFEKIYKGSQIPKEELQQKRRHAVGKLRPARQ